MIWRKQARCCNRSPEHEIARRLGTVSQSKQLALVPAIFIFGLVIAGCAGAEPTPSPAPAEPPDLNPPAQAAIPTAVTSGSTLAPATAAPSPTVKPLPRPSATPSPLPTHPAVSAPTSVPTQTPIDSKTDCLASVAGESIRPVQDKVIERLSGSTPDTYALKVRVETTSLWTSVEVIGVESMTAKYAITRGDGEINVDIEGLTVNDLSRPEGGPYQNQKVVLEIDAIVQKMDDTAVFRIRKGRSGTTVYRLFSGNGTSTKEIAGFTNDASDDGDNLQTFRLDLDPFPSPISFPTAKDRYKGPLFDAHVHLVGAKDREHTGRPDTAQYERLHINPETAERFFATLDRENVIGLIGFLKVIHENFVGDDSWNRPYQEQTLSVVNRCDNKIIPFLHPYSHIGIPPKEHGARMPKLIDQNIRGNPIPFRGIGEIHSGGILTDSYAEMRLVDPAMLELYDYAAANDLVVMIHPELSHIEDVHRALNHNPNTIFLLHGMVNTVETITEELEALFREHQNVYFSVDANLMTGYTLHHPQIENKAHFLANLHSNRMYYRLLGSALVTWKPIIEAYPTRMMWGTDLIYSWNFEPDVIHELTRYGRDFITGLDPDVQERFAYRNAVEMLDLP